jgi:hypothetical protein
MPTPEIRRLYMTRRSPERSSGRKLGGQAPKAKRKPSAADLRRELSRQTVELAEAREQQAATAEILAMEQAAEVFITGRDPRRGCDGAGDLANVKAEGHHEQ